MLYRNKNHLIGGNDYENLVILGALLTLGASSAAVIGVNQTNQASSNHVLHLNEENKSVTKETVESTTNTVSEEEWKELLSTANNFTFTEISQVDGITATQYDTVVDGDKICDKGSYETIEDGKYYYYYTDHNKWIKKNSNDTKFVESKKFKVFIDSYNEFSYNADTNEYTLDTLKNSPYEHLKYQNIKISFENKNIKNIKFDLASDVPSFNLKFSYDYYKFNTSSVVVPEGATNSINEVI